MSALWGERRQYLIFLGILSPNYLCPELSYCERFSRWFLWCWQFTEKDKGALVWLCCCISSFWKCSWKSTLPSLPQLSLSSPPPAEQRCGYLFIFSQQTKTPCPFQTVTFPFKGPLKGLKNLIAYIFLKTEILGNLQGRRALKENAKFHSNYHH